jgi:histone deacetylase 1/2
MDLHPQDVLAADNMPYHESDLQRVEQVSETGNDFYGVSSAAGASSVPTAPPDVQESSRPRRSKKHSSLAMSGDFYVDACSDVPIPSTGDIGVPDIGGLPQDRDIPLFACLARSVRKPVDHRKPTDRQARAGPDAEKWSEARDKEMASLTAAGTFEEALPPPGFPVVPTKWVYVIKPDSGKYKARLVACGNRDPFEGETYAPTANKAIMWLMFAVSVVLRLFCKVVDVSSAFVAHEINRECYVRIEGKVYRLKKFLYGLIDSPKGFNDGMTAYVKSGGYSQSIFDPCLFYKWVSVTSFVYIMVHVDDFSIMGSTEEIVDEFIQFLEERYDITLKAFDQYLGMDVTNLPDGSRVFTRPKRLEMLFEKWLPAGDDIRIPDIPLDVEFETRRSKCSDPCVLADFQSLLGSLLHLIDVRPDICDSISRVSQSGKSPNAEDMKALQRVVRYLYGTKELGIVLRPGMDCGSQFLQLRAFADAAYACARDGRSKYSYCFDLVPVGSLEADVIPYDPGVQNSGMFYSKSRFATTTALSSTDAEHHAITECVKTVILFRGVLEELRLPQLRPTPVFNDNNSAITLGNQFSGNYSNIRYIMPRINWLIEQVKSGVCKMFHLGTEVLPADMETKILRNKDFKLKRDLRMGTV